MLSPLTPFQAVQQRTAISLSGLYNATEVSHAGTFPLDDVSPTSTSLSSGLCTPFDDSSLLSPLGIPSLINNTLGPSIRPTGNDHDAYIQVMRQYKLMQNKLHKEKHKHRLLK